MYSKPRKVQNSTIRILLMLGGLMAVFLGILGIFLPILPTTPFFLLAASLFLRSSQRLYRWLLTHRLFGQYIHNYIHYKAISKGVKVFTLVLLWSTISISIYMMSEILWVQILLLVVAVAVSIHILMLRSMPRKG